MTFLVLGGVQGAGGGGGSDYLCLNLDVTCRLGLDLLRFARDLVHFGLARATFVPLWAVSGWISSILGWRGLDSVRSVGSG